MCTLCVSVSKKFSSLTHCKNLSPIRLQSHFVKLNAFSLPYLKLKKKITGVHDTRKLHRKSEIDKSVPHEYKGCTHTVCGGGGSWFTFVAYLCVVACTYFISAVEWETVHIDSSENPKVSVLNLGNTSWGSPQLEWRQRNILCVLYSQRTRRTRSSHTLAKVNVKFLMPNM